MEAGVGRAGCASAVVALPTSTHSPCSPPVRSWQDAAIDRMHNTEVDGRRISVTRAVPQNETAPGTPADALRRGTTVPRDAGRQNFRCDASVERGGGPGAGAGRHLNSTAVWNAQQGNAAASGSLFFAEQALLLPPLPAVAATAAAAAAAMAASVAGMAAAATAAVGMAAVATITTAGAVAAMVVVAVTTTTAAAAMAAVSCRACLYVACLTGEISACVA